MGGSLRGFCCAGVIAEDCTPGQGVSRHVRLSMARMWSDRVGKNASETLRVTTRSSPQRASLATNFDLALVVAAAIVARLIKGQVMDEEQIRAFLSDRRPDEEFQAIYGPMRIADAIVWEVWVLDEDEFETRFVEEGDPPILYDTFLALSLKLNDRHIAVVKVHEAGERAKSLEQTKMQADLALQASDAAAKRFSSMMKDIMAAGAFLIALLVFVYLVAIGRNDILAFGILASVAASACAFYYGKFIRAKLRDLFGIAS